MNEPSAPFFRAGEPIPQSGIYRVFHADHRVRHDITLLRGESFPRCEQCGVVVQFQLLRAAPSAQSGIGFRVRLYAVPHPESNTTE